MLCTCLHKEFQEKSWIISQPKGEAGTGNLPNPGQTDGNDDDDDSEDNSWKNNLC